MTAEDEEEAEEEAAKPKEKETVWEWELLNDAKPIWLRSPSDVSEEEYAKFYQAISKVGMTPRTRCLILGTMLKPSASPWARHLAVTWPSGCLKDDWPP